MINLLPTDLKEEYLYARRNTTLRHWALALFAGLLGTCTVALAGYFYMQSAIHDLNQKVAATEQTLQEQKLKETQKQAEEITSNLKLAVDVLSKEVLFSQLLKQIGTVMPPNTTLSDLSISEVSGAIELVAASSDYNSATQLHVNLNDPANKIFSKADLLSVDCSTAGGDNPRYPCSLRVRALFSKDNPFLFINNKASKP